MDPLDRLLAHLEYAPLYEALARLPEDQHKAITLLSEGYSVSEIAEALECCEVRVYQILQNAKRSVRRYLGEPENARSPDY